MKLLVLPALALPLLLGGCATGYVTDWFSDGPAIINPQLLRYGLDVEGSRCVGERLGQQLPKREVRRFQERLALVRPAGTAPLTLGNLRAVANRFGEVRTVLDGAVTACNVAPGATAAVATVTTGETGATIAETGTLTSGGVPVDMTPITPSAGASAAVATTWLNLGAAESGQSIAIDASSILQEGETRTAWFRMTDPQSGARTNNFYRLKIDCAGRTVQPLALRQTDAAGAQVSMREYSPTEAAAGPAESGTVLEIAFLSMCT